MQRSSLARPVTRGAAFLALAAFVLNPLAFAGDDAAPVAPAPAGVVFEPGPPVFAAVLKKAEAEGKAIFLDFSTTWCGWCRRLERDTFAKPEVGEAMQAFVNVAYDAERGEGATLAERYRARGFPTLVVVDAEGEEIDRIVGYRAPDTFLAEIARIRRGEGTLPALREAARKAPDDASLALALADRLAVSHPAEALELAVAIESTAAYASPAVRARALGVMLSIHRETGDADALVRVAERLLEACGGEPAAIDAAEVLILRAIPRGPDADVEPALAYAASLRPKLKGKRFSSGLERVLSRLHRTAAEQTLTRSVAAAGDDPMALNEAAWTMYLMKGDNRKAVAWARRAVDLSKRDPAMLDTLASLLADTGALDEAIALEEEALATLKDESMRNDFVENVAKWKAVRHVRQVRKTGSEPAPPTVVPEPTDEPDEAEGK